MKKKEDRMFNLRDVGQMVNLLLATLGPHVKPDRWSPLARVLWMIMALGLIPVIIIIL